LDYFSKIRGSPFLTLDKWTDGLITLEKPSNVGGEKMLDLTIPESLPVEKSLSDFPKHEVNTFMSQLLHMKNMHNKCVAKGSVLNVFDGVTGEVQENR
jgi:hypothetical protein